MAKILTIGLLLDDTLDRSDGVQQAVLTIGKELSSRGHSVHYIVPDTKRTDIPNIHCVGKFLSAKFNGNSVRTPLPASREKIKQLFHDVNFDVLHVQMPFSPFLSAEVLRQAPKYVVKVGTFHILPYNIAAKYGTKLLGIVTQKTIRSLNTVFAVSEPAKIFMDDSFKVDGIVVPNPVDYAYYHSFVRQNHKKQQIVFVGRFEERKGVEELVRAYANVPKHVQQTTELTMCGKGPLFEKVEKLAKDLAVEVKFPGFVTEDQKAQYLCDADIAVFPSKSGESFGIVLAEAMSAGAGITIGGNNPGYASVLGEWPETLFNPINIETFSQLFIELLQNDSLRLKIGNLQHNAVKKYDTSNVVNTLLDYYENSSNLHKEPKK